MQCGQLAAHDGGEASGAERCSLDAAFERRAAFRAASDAREKMANFFLIRC